MQTHRRGTKHNLQCGNCRTNKRLRLRRHYGNSKKRNLSVQGYIPTPGILPRGGTAVQTLIADIISEVENGTRNYHTAEQEAYIKFCNGKSLVQRRRYARATFAIGIFLPLTAPILTEQESYCLKHKQGGWRSDKITDNKRFYNQDNHTNTVRISALFYVYQSLHRSPERLTT